MPAAPVLHRLFPRVAGDRVHPRVKQRRRGPQKPLYCISGRLGLQARPLRASPAFAVGPNGIFVGRTVPRWIP